MKINGDIKRQREIKTDKGKQREIKGDEKR